MRADDALKYAAALLVSRTGWALDAISASACDSAGHEDEVDAIHAVVRDVAELAARTGNAKRYSDGRLVESSREIQYGLITSHVWHPNPAEEKPLSWRAALPSDPDVPSPGIYEVTTNPATQDIHVRVVRTA